MNSLFRKYFIPTAPCLIRSLIFLAFLTGYGALVRPPAVFAQNPNQNPDQKLNISYQNHMWTIIARNVDIKRVLSVIAEKAGIRVQFPPDAEKMVTLNRAGASIKALLKNLLIGWNHVIIYSGANQKTAKVVEVIVFSKKKPQPVNQAQVRIANRIQSYEKQIESLRQKLSTVGEDSARGKSYSRRIKMMEKTIDRLNRRAY